MPESAAPRSTLKGISSPSGLTRLTTAKQWERSFAGPTPAGRSQPGLAGPQPTMCVGSASLQDIKRGVQRHDRFHDHPDCCAVKLMVTLCVVHAAVEVAPLNAGTVHIE